MGRGMMLRLIAIAGLFSFAVYGEARAQPAAPPNPQEQIERTIGNLFITNTTLQAQLQEAKTQIAELKKQLEEAKKVSAK